MEHNVDMSELTTAVKLKDEIWIATALLHREHPEAVDFTVREIKTRLVQEGLSDAPRRGFEAHLSQHCLANRPRTTGRYRFLFATGPSRRRLFRSGDPFDPSREGGESVPRRDDLPKRYQPLLDWYEQQWAPRSSEQEDPLLALATRHRDVWAGVDADGYVRELREGFE